MEARVRARGVGRTPSAAARACDQDLARVTAANATHVTVQVQLQQQAPMDLTVRFAL